VLQRFALTADILREEGEGVRKGMERYLVLQAEVERSRAAKEGEFSRMTGVAEEG